MSDRKTEDLIEIYAHSRQMREAVKDLLKLLSGYYFEAGDEELEAVNRLRRMIGWRDQLPKGEEAELQVREAEGEG